MGSAVLKIRDPQATGLTVSGSRLLDSNGQTVVLRGINTEGVANFTAFHVAGSPGTPSIHAYLDKLVAPDSTGTDWEPTVVRLNFERYPCANPQRLYQAGDPRIPYCVPDTSQFPDWPDETAVVEGSVYKFSGTRYAATKRYWRADMGHDWNPGPFHVGERVVGLPIGTTHVYECTVAAAPAAVEPTPWDEGPQGTSGSPQVDGLGNTWVYVGEWGTTGASQPFGGSTVHDFYGTWYPDDLATWSTVGPDLTPEEAADAWDTFTTTVLDPVVSRAIANGLYVFICDFDFGPADLPLRTARMMDFWDRLSQTQWANHPKVMFDLWNESEDVAGFAGWTWTNQKPYVQAAVDLIRGNGANNVILVTTPAYCAFTHLATADPLTGSNIMYAGHFYEEFFIGTDNPTNLSTALASGQAVFVSEWGSNHPDSAAITDPFVADLMGRIEASYGSPHPAAGNMAWAFSRFWAPGFFNDDAFTVPNYYGTVVRDLLAALNP